MESNSSKAGIIIGALIALGIGLFGGYLIGNMNSNKTNDEQAVAMTQSTEQTDLRVAMNNLLREHVTTNLTVTRIIVDGGSAEKLDGAKAAQTANAVAIATAVGSVYGQEAQDAVTTPFVEHLVQSNAYAQAVADGDMAAQETALTALRAELRKVADVFNSVIPSVPADALYDALNAHEELINQAAVEYEAGNYTRAYELENEALVQISGGADVLTAGIVESKPDMF